MSIRRKKSIHDISDDTFKAVIEHLENGGTKKRACEMLNVSSNTTMERMVLEWQENQVVIAEMRKKKRGTPIEGIELANIIESYLQGDSFDEIASRNYRSTSMVKASLERAGALLRIQGTPDPLHPPMIPDEAVAESFEVGEHVWVPGYQMIGEIITPITNPVGGYRVYLLGESTQQYIHVMYYELASVRHLEKLGVNIKSLGYKWSKEDSYTLLNEAVRSALKREKAGK